MDDLKYDILNEKIDKIDEKIDKILDHSTNTDVTLAGQHVQLEIHVKRTNILEEEVKSIKEHTNMVNAVVKVAGVAIGGSSIIFGVLKYFKMI